MMRTKGDLEEVKEIRLRLGAHLGFDEVLRTRLSINQKGLIHLHQQIQSNVINHNVPR